MNFPLTEDDLKGVPTIGIYIYILNKTKNVKYIL
jgi:hypothetical protein